MKSRLARTIERQKRSNARRGRDIHRERLIEASKKWQAFNRALGPEQFCSPAWLNAEVEVLRIEEAERERRSQRRGSPTK